MERKDTRTQSRREKSLHEPSVFASLRLCVKSVRECGPYIRECCEFVSELHPFAGSVEDFEVGFGQDAPQALVEWGTDIDLGTVYAA